MAGGSYQLGDFGEHALAEHDSPYASILLPTVGNMNGSLPACSQKSFQSPPCGVPARELNRNLPIDVNSQNIHLKLNAYSGTGIVHYRWLVDRTSSGRSGAARLPPCLYAIAYRRRYGVFSCGLFTISFQIPPYGKRRA